MASVFEYPNSPVALGFHNTIRPSRASATITAS